MLRIKFSIWLLLIFVSGTVSWAQKVEVEKGIIQVEGKDIAKILKIKDKENFGLTSTYEIYSLSGEKLIIAAISTEFVNDMRDNSSFYYKLTFLTAYQNAVFSLSKLGPEKALAKLIGQSGIITGEGIDVKLLDEFIAKKSKNPPVAIVYEIVKRGHLGAVRMEGNQIIQGLTNVGYFKDVTDNANYDTYEFCTPKGLVVAKVSFLGGINAEKFRVITYKDRLNQNITIPIPGKYSIAQRAGVDRNEMALIRIGNWLTSNWYL